MSALAGVGCGRGRRVCVRRVCVRFAWIVLNSKRTHFKLRTPPNEDGALASLVAQRRRELLAKGRGVVVREFEKVPVSGERVRAAGDQQLHDGQVPV